MRNRHRDTDTRGLPCEDGGRDVSDESTSQGAPRIVGNHQKPGEGHGTYPPSDLPEGTDFADTLILDF